MCRLQALRKRCERQCLFGTHARLAAIPQAMADMAGFGAPVDDPRRPAGEHLETASIMSTRGTRNRPCSTRQCFDNF